MMLEQQASLAVQAHPPHRSTAQEAAVFSGRAGSRTVAAVRPQARCSRRRLRANLIESDWADEQMGGVSYLFFLRKLASDVELDWEGVLAS